MKTFTNVQSTAESINSLEINVDTVYIRTNVKDVHTEEQPVLWQYDEIQMSITEYLKQVVPENQDISDNALGELCESFSTYQMQTDMAIAELSQKLGTGK